MTDRVNHLVVALEQDIRTDDVEFIVNAIRALRYVAGVEMGIVDGNSYAERMRFKNEMRERLYSLIKEID